MQRWSDSDFIENVSSRISSRPSINTESAWGDIRAVRWTHPEHETATEALKPHFLALTISERVRIDCRVGSGKTQSTEMTKGALTFLPSGRAAEWHIQNPMTVLNVFIPDHFIRWLCLESGTDYTGVLGGKELLGIHDETGTFLAQAILHELQNDLPGNRLYIDSLLTALCIRLFLSQGLSLSPQPINWGPDRRRIRKTVDFMINNLAEDISLADLAETADLDVFQLCRSFKRTFAVSPAKYFNLLRVEKAKELLALTSLPSIDISTEVGLGTQSQFCRAFKRYVGLTPRQYRETKRD